MNCRFTHPKDEGGLANPTRDQILLKAAEASRCGCYWRNPSILAFALHPRLAGNFKLAGRIECGVGDLDLTLSLVRADDQAIWRDAGPGELERMRRRAVGEQPFAAAKHDRH